MNNLASILQRLKEEPERTNTLVLSGDIALENARMYRATRARLLAVVEALEMGLKFIHDVDIGCYSIPVVVENEITAKLAAALEETK